MDGKLSCWLLRWVLGVIFVSGMKKLGFGGRKLKLLVEEVGNEALMTSFWIWFMREEREWSTIGFNKVKDIQ